jgi:AcrR family transcriptional regulator
VVDGRSIPDRLREAALALFAEKGFAGTSVQDIVDAAGVTKGGMYHYFRSKEDLLYGIYAEVLQMQRDRLDRFADEEGPVEARLRAAAADVVRTAMETIRSSTIFYRSLHDLSEDKQRAVRAERRRYHERFRGMVLEGQRDGSFRADVDADVAVDYFFGAVHHLPVWWSAEGRLAPDAIADQFADLLLAGLVRPG